MNSPYVTELLTMSRFEDSSPELKIDTFTKLQPRKMPGTAGVDTATYCATVKAAGAASQLTWEQPKNADDLIDTHPLINVNGFYGFQKGYAAFRHDLASHGMIAATWASARTQKFPECLNARHIYDPTFLQCIMLGAIIKKLRTEFGVDNVDLTGNSYGGLVATETAERLPDMVRTLILNASTGIDRHTSFKMMPRTVQFEIEELWPSFPKIIHQLGLVSVVTNTARYGLQNPYRTAAEALVASNCNILPALKRLKAKRTKIATIFNEGDRLVHAQTAVPRVSGIADIIKVISGGHLATFTDSALVAQTHREILTELYPDRLTLPA